MRPPHRITVGAVALVLAAAAATLARAEEVIVTVPQTSTLPPVVVPNTPAEPASPAKAAKPAPDKATPAKTPAGTKSAAIDPKGDGSPGKAKGSGLSIAVLVNDEPITAYEITQRQRMMGMSANVGEKAQAAFKAMIKAPSTSERLKAILNDTIKANEGKSREQIIDIFERRKKEFAMGLQKQAMDNARNSVLPGLKKEALEELIDERLKLQEAKRLNVAVGEEDVDRIIRGIAEKNKMTDAEFAKHLKGSGADINMMRSRFKANMSWQEVIRRKFGSQIAITDREVDRFVEKSPGNAEDSFELQLQRTTLPIPPKLDQKLVAQRLAEADTLAQKGGGCAAMASNAATVAGAKFENLGSKTAGSIPEPTRSLLLNAKDGELLPPSVGAGGVEIWAVCGRKAITANAERRENAQAELRQKEFEVLARKHLKDLRQDAAIEYR